MSSINQKNHHKNKYEVEELCQGFVRRLKQLGYVLECDGTAFVKKITGGSAYEIVAETNTEIDDLEWYPNNAYIEKELTQ